MTSKNKCGNVRFCFVHVEIHCRLTWQTYVTL